MRYITVSGASRYEISRQKMFGIGSELIKPPGTECVEVNTKSLIYHVPGVDFNETFLTSCVIIVLVAAEVNPPQVTLRNIADLTVFSWIQIRVRSNYAAPTVIETFLINFWTFAFFGNLNLLLSKITIYRVTKSDSHYVYDNFCLICILY